MLYYLDMLHKVIWEVVATVFYFEDEEKNSVKVYIFRFINIPSTYQSRDHLDTTHAERAVQDTGKLGPCYDSAWKSKAKKVWFQMRTFFLNLKASLFLCWARFI